MKLLTLGRILGGLFFCVGLHAMQLQAQSNSSNLPPVSQTYALEHVTVHVAPGKTIENATLIIRDGMIASIGTGISVPGEAITLEADSMHVYAGFINGLHIIGGKKEGESRGRRERPRVANPDNPPNDVAGILPGRMVLPMLDPKEGDFAKLREAGFTVAHIAPDGNMLPGRGALISLAGETPETMRIKDDVSLMVQFEGTRGMSPATLLGVMAKFKQLYRQAELAVAHEKAYAANPAGMGRPAYDEPVRGFYPLIEKTIPAVFVAKDMIAVHRALNLQKEFGFPLILSGVEQAAGVVNELQAANTPVFLSLDLPEELKTDDLDSTNTEQMALHTRVKASYEASMGQAATLREAGVPFGFCSEGAKVSALSGNLQRLVQEGGLSEEEALAALTTTPAEFLGLSRQLGTVDEGKLAHLVISDKPYFSEKAKVRFVFVDGQLFEMKAKKKKKKAGKGESSEGSVNVAGKWNYTTESPQGKTGGVLSITGTPGNYEGTLSSDQSNEELELEDVSVDGNKLSFSFSFDGGGQTIFITVDADIEGETFEGNMTIGEYGAFPIEGERISKPD